MKFKFISESAIVEILNGAVKHPKSRMMQSAKPLRPNIIWHNWPLKFLGLIRSVPKNYWSVLSWTLNVCAIQEIHWFKPDCAKTGSACLYFYITCRHFESITLSFYNKTHSKSTLTLLSLMNTKFLVKKKVNQKGQSREGAYKRIFTYAKILFIDYVQSSGNIEQHKIVSTQTVQRLVQLAPTFFVLYYFSTI